MHSQKQRPNTSVFCTDFRVQSFTEILGNSEDFLDPTLNHMTLDFSKFNLILLLVILSCNCIFMEMAAREGVARLHISVASSAYCTTSPSVTFEGKSKVRP